MKQELYANVTVTEYFGLYSAVNTTSAEHILDRQVNQGGPCANFYKIPGKSFYVNKTGDLYPGLWANIDYKMGIQIGALLIILIVGLLGNISVILTIAYNRSMRTTVNFYIANLAVADTMTCIFALPAFYKVLPIHYALGEFVCKTGNFALCICMVCSVLTLSAISCDRFVAVFFPLHVRVTEQRKSLVATLIWILSMAASIPYALVNKMRITEYKDFQEKRCTGNWENQYYKHDLLGICVVRSPYFISQTLLQTVFLYFVPIVIMITAYSFILWKLSRTKPPGEQVAANDNVDSTGNRRVHKMVFAVLIVFALSWTPFHMGLLYDLIEPMEFKKPKQLLILRWIAWNVELGNSVMNPFIYAGMKKEFRKGIRAVLCCRKPIIKPKPPQNKGRALDVAKKPERREVNLEMENRNQVADHC